MRNIIHKVLSTILIAGGIGLITSAVYASVIFVGDTENVGFKSAQKISPAVDFTCPEGKNLYNGKCVAKCDQTTYPQAVALDETKGTIAFCTDVWGTYYTYTSCHNGWDLIEGDCIETDCSNFSYTSAPESIAGTVTSCKSGLNSFYKYLSCHEGWDFANGKCSVHSCSSTTYPYTSSPSSDAGTIVTCKTGVAIRYGYSNCRTGWDKSNGYCNIHVCDNNAFPFTSQPSSSIGTVVTCKTGNDVKYGYSACSDDYELQNGQCEIKCSYTATSKPTGCATVTDSCVKNGTTYYAATCTACDSGYTLSDGSCTACSWSGYTLASCPEHGICYSKTCGGITQYSLYSCEKGWEVGWNSNGYNCVMHECDFSEYNLTTCPSNASRCAECRSGDRVGKQVEACYCGYYGATCDNYVAGMIHYTDGTSSWNYNSSKTPDGVWAGQYVMGLQDGYYSSNITYSPRVTTMLGKTSSAAKKCIQDINAGLAAAGGTTLSGCYKMMGETGGTGCNSSKVNYSWAFHSNGNTGALCTDGCTTRYFFRSDNSPI